MALHSFSLEEPLSCSLERVNHSCIFMSNVAPNTLTISQTTNFRLFQTENEFADNNLKFDKNGRKLSKRVENTDRK